MMNFFVYQKIIKKCKIILRNIVKKVNNIQLILVMRHIRIKIILNY
jgi:hypothetical protein